MMGSEVNSSEADEGVNVHIRCSNGSKFTVKTSLDSSVGSFKQVLAQHCDVPADQQRLIYKGRILKDDQTLESYGIIKIVPFLISQHSFGRFSDAFDRLRLVRRSSLSMPGSLPL